MPAWFALIPLARDLLAELRRLHSQGGIERRLNEIHETVENINVRALWLAGKVASMSQEVEALGASAGRIEAGVNRAVAELRDLASKLQNSDDRDAIVAITNRLEAAASALNTTVDEVDTDGSSPQV